MNKAERTSWCVYWYEKNWSQVIQYRFVNTEDNSNTKPLTSKRLMLVHNIDVSRCEIETDIRAVCGKFYKLSNRWEEFFMCCYLSDIMKTFQKVYFGCQYLLSTKFYSVLWFRQKIHYYDRFQLIWGCNLSHPKAYWLNTIGYEVTSKKHHTL